MADPTPLAPVRSASGFSLIELMVTVAVVSILASIAIPSFTKVRLQSMRSEMPTVLSGVAIAEMAYFTAHEAVVKCSTSPTTTLDGKLNDFNPNLTGWRDIEYAPDGKVRCHYRVDTFTNAGRTWARPTAVCDLDGDNNDGTWYMDVDPKKYSSSSQHWVLRGNNPTTANYYF